MNRLYILQSLREKDRKTGKEIFDNLKNKCKIFFKEYRTKQELIDILEFIKVDIQTTDKKPFVHFDCHGNENGIGVVKVDSTEELITWNEIGDLFREIYIASTKKSILCFSSCKGFNSIKVIPEFKICPFDYVAGSFEEIGFDDSYEAFNEFYKQLISGIDIKSAAYHIHKKYDKMKFICFSSKVLFELGAKSYLELKTTKEELEKRKQTTVKALGSGSTLNQLQNKLIEYKYSEQGQKDYVEEWRQIFFS